ncbi:hypothetical protein LB553_02565 [Mesorhizobium sp. CA8]|uniref:hypothetical protein n=1 Tax=unclassified Mesorhizobium TaxID=325217 RepID=UPI001CCE8F7B|nr:MULTISPECIES: hypothetical protein [unclassified Mesorhizobium]MBZ9759765.1 hypothetical protein [Mesorhizobium sp. CA8]MBZ9819741.1 hypothetical protein [Mesorhizobium sp. CA4]
MHRISINLMGALLSLSLTAAATGIPTSKVAPLTRTERCTNLSRQVDEALKTHAAAMQVTAAKALQRKGNRYCAKKKEAQGIRMFAKALKLLGVTPIDPDE